MNNEDQQNTVRVLEEIRDNQKLQLQHQKEALSLQKEQFALFQKQIQRTERIQDRAEQLQDRGAQIIGVARKSMIFVLPILIFLIVYVSWLIFR